MTRVCFPAARCVPRLTLQTLTRGDGLLGLKPFGKLGPRGDSVTVAQLDWTYALEGGLRWHTPAPVSILNTRPQSTVDVLAADGRPLQFERDLAAEADALDRVRDLGLCPVPPDAFQWRNPEGEQAAANVWTLAQEDHFGDFFAEAVPCLQALGWAVLVKPGFAHVAEPVQGWNLALEPLHLPKREGEWLLSLGIELHGQTLDLAPMLADLLRRDARWLSASEIAQIDDLATIVLRAPGGKRIEAPAAPLKAIVGAMLDLLTDPRRAHAPAAPLHLHLWDAQRLDALRTGLLDTHRVGQNQAWQLQGEA
ncbi:MAG: hypothetical protein RIR45_2096, partial [Pseudomonadota bacterium]